MKCRDLNGTIIKVIPTAANTEFAVAHEMDVIPRGAFILLRPSPVVLYLGTTPWDKDFAYVKSSASGVEYYVLFFV